MALQLPFHGKAENFIHWKIPDNHPNRRPEKSTRRRYPCSQMAFTAKRQKKVSDKVKHDNTLAFVVDMWLGMQDCSEATINRKRNAITADLLPSLGKMPITNIEASIARGAAQGGSARRELFSAQAQGVLRRNLAFCCCRRSHASRSKHRAEPERRA